MASPSDYTYPLEAENLAEWIKSNSHRLSPPVCNALMHTQDLKTMIVGGPNVRRDFHVNPTDEWFYQLTGPMVLTIIDKCGTQKHIPINEGEHFLLPPNIPHSPQRFPDTIGLVMEARRPEGMLDRLTYYCPKCQNINFTDAFVCNDLGTQLRPFIEEYYSNDTLRKCKECNHDDVKPTIPVEIPDSCHITPQGVIGNEAIVPTNIEQFISTDADTANTQYIGKTLQITKVDSKTQENGQPVTTNGERWVYAIKGNAIVNVHNNDNKIINLKLGECVLLPPCNHTITVNDDTSTVIICTFVDIDAKSV